MPAAAAGAALVAPSACARAARALRCALHRPRRAAAPAVPLSEQVQQRVLSLALSHAVFDPTER